MVKIFIDLDVPKSIFKLKKKSPKKFVKWKKAGQIVVLFRIFSSNNKIQTKI